MTEITVFGSPGEQLRAHRRAGSPKHLALHPFDRVPILQHADFMLYETSAIVTYLDEVFPQPRCSQRSRATGR